MIEKLKKQNLLKLLSGGPYGSDHDLTQTKKNLSQGLYGRKVSSKSVGNFRSY